MILKNRYIRKKQQYLYFFQKRALNLILMLTLSIYTSISQAQEETDVSQWKELTAGLKYKVIYPSKINPFAQLHIFELDLNKINISFCPLKKVMTAKMSAIKSNALVALNGAFFSPSYTPIGLRISNGKIWSKYKNISWWRIFYIENNKAYINNLNTFNSMSNISFAIQSGPILVKNGRIPKLKDSFASRTAIGIKKNGHIIMVVSENTQVTTTFIAKFMKNKLKCYNALNLDGGGSTQMYINTQNVSSQVIGLTKLPDPICLHALKN